MLVFFGARLPRFADRLYFASFLQLSPRATRSEPVVGPVGSSVGELA